MASRACVLSTLISQRTILAPPPVAAALCTLRASIPLLERKTRISFASLSSRPLTMIFLDSQLVNSARQVHTKRIYLINELNWVERETCMWDSSCFGQKVCL